MKNLVNKGFKYFVAIMMVFSLMSMNAWANGPESGTSSETGSTTTENKGTTKDTGDSQGDTADQLISNEEKKTNTSKESDDKEGQTDQTTDKKTDYTYEDKKISVKAVLANASAISDQAELRVKEIPEYTTEYKKYQEALNKKSNLYSNVLLYDISFILDGKEVEPTDGNVKVSMSFKDQQLSDDLNVKDNNDLKVIHFKDNDVNKQESLKTTTSVKNETTSFETKSFSAYAVVTENGTTKNVYTVNNFQVPDYGYGVTAEDYYQAGDTETNIYVDNYFSTASEVGASQNYSNAGGNYYIGKFTENTAKPVRFNLPPANVYLGSSAYNDYINKKITFEKFDMSSIHQVIGWSAKTQIDKMSQVYSDALKNVSFENIITSNSFTVDLRNLPSGTYAVKFSGNHIDPQSKIFINEGQHLIFYCTTAGNFESDRYKIAALNTGQNENERKEVESQVYVGSKNSTDDWKAEAVSFYMPDVTELRFPAATCGIFVAPKASVTKGSSCGGVIGVKSFGTSTSYAGGEWHYHNHELPSPDDVQFKGKKQFSNDKWPESGTYNLTLTAIDNAPMPSNQGENKIALSKASPTGKFSKITYVADSSKNGKEEHYYYEISEKPGEVKSVVYDSTVYEVKVDVAYGDDGSAVVTGTSYKKYKTDPNGNTQYIDNNWVPFDDGYQFTFTNSIQEEHKLSLQVNKKDENGTKPLTGAVFNLKKDGDFGDGETFNTNDKPSASFENLDPNAKYTLTEKKAPTNYKTSGPWIVETSTDQVSVYLSSDSKKTNIAKAIDGQSYAFSVDIKDEIKKFGFELRKTDAENGQLITNNSATFTLSEIKSIDSSGKMDLEKERITFETNNQGIHKGDNVLVAGKSYYLEETKAPTGYAKSGPWIIEVNDTGATFYTVTNTNGVISDKKEDEKSTSDSLITYTVTDKKEYTLPSTGGIGTKKYYLLGTLLSMLGVIYIVMKLGKGGLFRKEDHS